GTANETTIEVLGTWTLRAETTGKGSTVSWNPEGNGGDLVLRLLDAQGNVLGNGQAKLTLNDILGKAGVAIPPNPLVQGSIAAPEHAIGNDQAPATKTATEASAAADILKLQLLQPDPSFQGVDIRLGHLETKAIAPAGGLECPIPVSKTANPDPVTAGQDFTWTITVPSVPDPEIACDLTNVSIDDVSTVLSGSPSATITGASNGGVIGSNTVAKGKSATVKWTGLGPIKPGQQLAVTITGHIPANSGAGVLQNLATVHATLANCTGGVAGSDFVSNATVNGRATAVNGAAVLGSATVQGPNVKAAAVAPARLAETGQKQPWLPVVGGGLLLGSLALMRSRRRLHAVRNDA
ncbi:MAG: LPXTG cell wall anchor domain-containing protein, partial [Geminicoccaceae bacterium]